MAKLKQLRLAAFCQNKVRLVTSENPNVKVRVMQQTLVHLILLKNEVARGFCAGPHIYFFFYTISVSVNLSL